MPGNNLLWRSPSWSRVGLAVLDAISHTSNALKPERSLHRDAHPVSISVASLSPAAILSRNGHVRTVEHERVLVLLQLLHSRAATAEASAAYRSEHDRRADELRPHGSRGIRRPVQRRQLCELYSEPNAVEGRIRGRRCTSQCPGVNSDLGGSVHSMCVVTGCAAPGRNSLVFTQQIVSHETGFRSSPTESSHNS